MKSTIAVAVFLGFAVAAASATSVLAQSSVPGAAPPKPGKLTAAPQPPPPPRGDKLSTHTPSPTPGPGPRSVPNLGYWPSPSPDPIDDIAGQPAQSQAGHGGSTCSQNLGPARFGACVSTLALACYNRGGEMRENDDGSWTCVTS